MPLNRMIGTKETYRYDGVMLRRWLSAEVRVAAAVTGIALAAGCSAQAAPVGVGSMVGGLRQFCQTNPFPWGGMTSGGPGHASGTVTLCARWHYKEGAFTLAEVRGYFTSASGYLENPSLRFSVVTVPVPPGGLRSVLVPARAIPAHASGHSSSADTGWFAAARLTGHSRGSLSWQGNNNPYLSLDLVAGGASGATINAGGAGMIPDAYGQFP
jgi:hypothetical protein